MLIVNSKHRIVLPQHRSIELIYHSIELVFCNIKLVYHHIKLVYCSIELFYHVIELPQHLIVISKRLWHKAVMSFHKNIGFWPKFAFPRKSEKCNKQSEVGSMCNFHVVVQDLLLKLRQISLEILGPYCSVLKEKYVWNQHDGKNAKTKKLSEIIEKQL